VVVGGKAGSVVGTRAVVDLAFLAELSELPPQPAAPTTNATAKASPATIEKRSGRMPSLKAAQQKRG